MGFELDIRTTQDGKLVVLHDATLGRTTNGTDEPVTKFIFTELSKFEQEAGSIRVLQGYAFRVSKKRSLWFGSANAAPPCWL
jgi:glycerophosphoryl diester phosphodiesterase